ncbi:hypothetical protein RhiirC2_781150 [Rhizophagus irregularis]|uniref:Uncharacterized protein n=1 Tax=Rhizophagus irregularis TaxID=588596 RepID=A0A2N1N5Z7_9GLOM|nr:hypothetical protein RhiirC2_781150 [Rhizophagus irregularis]
MEGRHFPRRRNEKLIAVNTKIYVNIRERPIETKEVHCTTAYERKSVNFQWTVTREMVMLEESDTVETATERKVIQFSADEDFIEIPQQPFSSYTFPEMKALFGLKADDCNEFLESGDEKETPEEI